MNEGNKTEEENELSAESIRRSVDTWYMEALALLDLEADVALTKIAKLQTQAMRLHTLAQRHQARTINAMASREITPILEMLAEHAKLIGRASSIRRRS